MFRIIAVSHFGSRDVAGLLESLVRQQREDWELLIVDNSESDEELAELSHALRNESRARVERAPKNLGYFGAARWALARFPSGGGWIIVSNTDIRIDSTDFFDVLASPEFSLVDIVAPSIISSRDGRDQNPHLIARPTAQKMMRRRLALSTAAVAQAAILLSALKRRIGQRVQTPVRSDQRNQHIYAAHGSFMVFNEKYFRSGGNLAHPVFLFAEELSVAEQCRRLGLSTLYAPKLRVEHIEHGQMGLFRSREVLRFGAEASKYAHRLIADRG